MPDSSSTTTTTLPAFQLEGIKDLYNRTKGLVNTGLPIYQGQRVADLDPSQTQAIQSMISYATGPRAQTGINTAIDANTFWADPNRVFDLQSVPGYAASRAGIESSVGRALTESWLPQIRGEAILNNGLGNNRAGLAEGQAVGRATEALTTGLGNLDMNTAQMLLGANQNAIGRAPSLVAAGTVPQSIALDAGGILQNQRQAQIDAERQKFEETANAPYFGLDQLRASLGMNTGGTTRTSTSQDRDWLGTLGGLALLGKSFGLFG
jgi:hypothetical protein